MKSSYNPKVVTAFFASHGIPEPEYEFRFHPERKWRFDIAWKVWHKPIEVGGFESSQQQFSKLALEIDGGIWIRGGHNRGAQMLKTWEKENTAACMGWRILRCQPKDLMTKETAELIKRALNL